MEELISVIVPVYKVEKYIHKCVDSIINQTYKYLEIILVDDGSPDECGKICDEYAEKDNRIIVIHQKNSGQCVAQNMGLKKMSGEYVAFVDSDDYLEKDYLQKMREGIQDKQMAISGFKQVDFYGNVLKEVFIKDNYIRITEENSEKLVELIDNSSFGISANKLYKSSLIKKYEFLNLMPREDLVFNLSLLNEVDGFMCVGDNTGYCWLQREESTLHSSNLKNVESTVDISKKILEIEMGMLSKESQNCIYNHIMKVLLADTIMYDIIKNQSLTEKEKKCNIKFLLRDNLIRKNLIASKTDNKYIKCLLLCAKLGVIGDIILLKISEKLINK